MAHRNAKIGVGTSLSENPEQAGIEAARNAIINLHDKPKFGFLFCSDKRYFGENNVKLLIKSAHEEFVKANSDFNWIGCTTPHISGCVALIVSSENVHTGIGIGALASKAPTFAGERAIYSALSQIDLGKSMESYVSSLTETDEIDEDKLQPYLLTVLAPNSTKTESVVKGIANVTKNKIPIFKGAGCTFSNGILFKDSAICLLQAFDKDGDWFNFQNQWLSSVFGINNPLDWN